MSDPPSTNADRPADPSSTRTPRSLLDRARADDAAAWEALVGLYAPLALDWCRRWGLQESDAADVVQEVFGAVVAHLAGFRRDRPGDTFRGWLRTILRNKVRDHFRRLGREPAGEGGTDALVRLAGVADRPAGGEDAEGPEALLFRRGCELIRGEFHDRTWQAFWRTAADGRPAPDVAAELGMSPAAVRVAKCRVLQRLREVLGDLDG